MIFQSTESIEKIASGHDQNYFELIGTVGDLRQFAGGLHVDVRVPYDNGKVQAPCTPTITFYGDDAIQAIKKAIDPSKHPKVCIVGTIHTRRSDKNGETRYYQDLVGESIAFVNGYVQTNELRLVGEITNIHYPAQENGSPPCVMMTIRTILGERMYFPKIIGFERLVRVAHQFKEGDRIAVYGSVFTKSRYEETGWKFYQSIVVTGFGSPEIAA